MVTATEAAVKTDLQNCLTLMNAGHDFTYAPLRTDAMTLVKNVLRALGIPDDSSLDAQVLAAIIASRGDLAQLQSEADTILRVVEGIASHFTVPPPILPSGLWTWKLPGGGSFQGRSPMPVSIVDSSAPYSVAVGDLKDSRGEPAAAGATVALSVDDADAVTLVDNGDGTGTVGPGPLATATLPANVGIHATVTNPDATSFTIDDVVTIVAGDAVTGDFTFTPPV